MSGDPAVTGSAVTGSAVTGPAVTGGSAADPAATAPVLSVRNLSVQFPTKGGGAITPVRGVDLDLRRGGRLGLVGESGSGKSLTALALMRLIRPPGRISGRLLMDGRNLLDLPERQMVRYRGSRIAMVYQNPMSALNPVFTIGRQIAEAVRLARPTSRRQAHARAVELLDEVGVPAAARRVDSYPHEFSGGMRQRVVIAMALAGEPDVVIADEPTTALDVTTQARVIELLGSLADRHGLSVMLITHDLGVAATFCDDINVMYAGRIVERADVRGFFRHQVHPYAQALLSSVCGLDADVDQPIPAIAGQPPLPGNLPPGCSFAPRCGVATERCPVETPVPVDLGGGREAECLYAHERVGPGAPGAGLIAAEGRDRG
jgi:oligopeptide/dipeptide ABC transporter ATP-binding protein